MRRRLAFASIAALSVGCADVPDATDDTHEEIGVAQQATSASGLPAAFPHIRFLTPGQEAEIPILLESRPVDDKAPSKPKPARIVTISDPAAAVIEQALQSLPPLLLLSVQTIAFVSWPADALENAGKGAVAYNEVVAVNAEKLESVTTAQAVRAWSYALTHEAAHSFTYLVDAATATVSPRGWSADATSAARDLIDKFRLARGLSRTWQQLHESGMPLGLAGKYPVDQSSNAFGRPDAPWTSMSDQAAWDQGFISPYGSAAVYEDIAEAVGWVQSPFTKRARVCSLFAGKSQLEPALALLYAKLALVNALGLVDKNNFESCVNGIGVGAPTGFSFPGRATFANTTSRRDGAGTSLVSAGNGGTYRFGLELTRADPARTLLGLYELEAIDPWSSLVGVSAAYLGNEEPFAARASREGLVLVTEESASKLAGFVFDLSLQNAGGLVTDRWQYGTFSIP